MKLVNRKEFLAIEGHEVVFSRLDELDTSIKLDTSIDNDFYYQPLNATMAIDGDSSEVEDILYTAETTKASIPLDFDETSKRDGLVEPDDTQYAVWEREDVLKLIARLQRVVDHMPNI